MDKRLADANFLTSWILSLEQKFPVEEWTVDGIHVWPLIRIRLNLEIFSQFNADSSQEVAVVRGATKASLVLRFIKEVLRLIVFMAKPLRKTRVIYAGFSGHRILWQGTRFNRYFDPIMDQFEKSDENANSKLIEYEHESGDALTPLYRSDRVIRYHEFKWCIQRLFSALKGVKRPQHTLPEFDSFLDALESSGLKKDDYGLEDLINRVTIVTANAWFFKQLLRKTGAGVAVGLCYYADTVYGMNLAARDRGVVSVDLQHGGQGDLHLAYARFTKLPPTQSYELLPRYFWCWDKSSADVIERWARTSGHGVLVGGHPWLQFIQEWDFEKLEDGNKRIILLTLQPYKTLLEEYLVAAIKETCSEFKWYLRLHPRQFHQLDALKDLLKANDLTDSVEVDKAMKTPIPIILKYSSLHLTRSSGSAIEAALMGVPTIILDKLGVGMFSDLINQGKAWPFVQESATDLINLISRTARNSQQHPASDHIRNWNFILQLKA